MVNSMQNPMLGNPMQSPMFTNFMQNPLQFLLQRNINLPQEYANNPQGAVQYLMNTGRMSQTTFETLRGKATQLGANL